MFTNDPWSRYDTNQIHAQELAPTNSSDPQVLAYYRCKLVGVATANQSTQAAISARRFSILNSPLRVDCRLRSGDEFECDTGIFQCEEG